MKIKLIYFLYRLRVSALKALFSSINRRILNVEDWGSIVWESFFFWILEHWCWHKEKLVMMKLKWIACIINETQFQIYNFSSRWVLNFHIFIHLPKVTHWRMWCSCRNMGNKNERKLYTIHTVNCTLYTHTVIHRKKCNSIWNITGIASCCGCVFYSSSFLSFITLSKSLISVILFLLVGFIHLNIVQLVERFDI